MVEQPNYSIDNFRLATPEEVEEMQGGHGILIFSPRGISTYVVYQFLKSRFGKPNQDPLLYKAEGKVTWEYVLKGPRRYLAIHDWKLYSWSVSIRLPTMVNEKENLEEATKYDNEARADANVLLDRISKYAETFKVPVTKHSFQVIENAFKTSYSYGEILSGSLEKPIDRFNYSPTAQSVIHSESREDSSKAWASAMAYILSIEALFNILFEVYLKGEIFKDGALRQHILRLPLADKWLLFGSLCGCFSKPLDRVNQGYQSLRRLVDIRNNWAHVNIGEEMRTYIIEEDKLSFATSSSPIDRNTEPGLSSVDYYWVMKVKEDVDRVKSEILNAMKSSARRKFEKALEDGHIYLTGKRALVL
jgi:hypothetical protein